MTTVPVAPPLEIVTSPCVAHRRHGPSALTKELHHTIPVAWQLLVPARGDAPFPGRDQAGRGKLWDCRTVALCPTGHRNTHVWLVRLMRAAAAARSDDPLVAYKAVRPRFWAPPEFKLAYSALTRFMAEAGSGSVGLLTLCDAGQWGMA